MDTNNWEDDILGEMYSKDDNTIGETTYEAVKAYSPLSIDVESLFISHKEDKQSSQNTEVNTMNEETPSNLFEKIQSVNFDQVREITNSSKTKKTIFTSFFGGIIFTCKYIFTSAIIFGILLVFSNYSAYINIVKSYIYQEEMAQNEKDLISSVAAANIVANEKVPIETENKEEVDLKVDIHSMKQLLNNANNSYAGLDINITPYGSRIVIPKIGKNVPLLDIAPTTVSGQNELNDIFMDELQNGVVRYPGSAKPGNEGNTFIFGHSSNYPWVKGNYNDVFALLDKVVYDDIVVIYYNQKKYTYKIKEKTVIRPGDVSVLKRNKGKSELTLMTCWPIGTTLNRLIVIGELIDTE